MLHLSRSPGRIAMSTDADERGADEVLLSGDAEPVRPAAVACDDGGAQGVLLFPLAHTATLRIAIVLDATERTIDPNELPSASQVASGWATHSRGGARMEVPDRRLREAIAASTRFLLLAGDEEVRQRVADRVRHVRQREMGFRRPLRHQDVRNRAPGFVRERLSPGEASVVEGEIEAVGDDLFEGKVFGEIERTIHLLKKVWDWVF